MILLFSAIRYYYNYISKKQTAEIERQLTEMKFKFFTNISHEFLTPLSLIITPLSSIIKDIENSEIKSKLQSVYNNAQDLLSLVNHLLDFRKLEMQEEKLVLMNGDINEFIYSVYESFKPLADNSGIDFNCSFKNEKSYFF